MKKRPDFLSSSEALDTILDNVFENKHEIHYLSDCCGKVLAEDINSDIDMPPFNRSAMDGYAICGTGEIRSLLPEIKAGDRTIPVVSHGIAVSIMTGAPVPEGADRVVIVEQTRIIKGNLHIESFPEQNENICFRGEDIRKGQTVLKAGQLLAPQHAGIAAMAGRELLKTVKKPSIALLTTGTEIVPPGWSPAVGQVRNANMPLMTALIKTSGFDIITGLHCTDDPSLLKSTMDQLLRNADVLLVAGGISMGRYDFVPEVLKSLQTDILFRSVSQKPGKPFFFGLWHKKPVFGLPGNPVSVLVCIEEYVIPALRKISGFRTVRKREFKGKTVFEYRKKTDRTHFLRTIVSPSSNKLTLPETSGSGDLQSTSEINSFTIIPQETDRVETGDELVFHLLATSAGEFSFQ